MTSSAYVFIDFPKCNLPEYKIYKTRLIDSLAIYFCVLTKTFNPNLVGKCFSVYLSLGGVNTENPNKNYFCLYQRYMSKFPEIKIIIQKLSMLYTSFAKEICLNRRTNIVVFDMDETLIDDSMTVFYKSIFKDLLKYRRIFQYVILWTHGTTPYLSEVMLDFKFDMYMSRNTDDSENKGLGAVLRELNKMYGIQKLDFCVLVDDGAFNYENDYDLFVHVNQKPKVGSYASTLDVIEDCMDNYYQNKKYPKKINNVSKG